MEQALGYDLFQEILEYHQADWTQKVRYTRLNGLLDRATKQLTAHFAAEYTSLYARLFVLCRQANYMYKRPIELFRLNARRVIKEEYTPNEHDYIYDLKALCEFISFFYNTPIPAAIRKILPKGWREFKDREQQLYAAKRMRVVVNAWDNTFIYVFDEETDQENPLVVNYTTEISTYFNELKNQIHVGTQLNLLDVKVYLDNETEKFIYTPRLIVLEPDFLIDISALSACLENYGVSELTYLYNKFNPNEIKNYTLLGNAANQFLDDLVNEDSSHPATWLESIRRNFRDYLLDYSICDNIDNDYFDQSKSQFQNLKEVVHQRFGDASVDITKSDALLEPTIFCESMGLQGRLDLMLNDYSRIIELKSGKCDEFRKSPYPKHSLQMALYQEVLYYSLGKPKDQIRTFLLYSKYPHLIEQRATTAQIQAAMALRNAIVYQEQQLRNGKAWDILSQLTPEKFNTKGDTSKLWTGFIRPKLDTFLSVFQQTNPLEATYFNAFTEFVEREQFLSKMGDEQPDSGRGFAETWNSDVLTKQANGNILTDLSILQFHKDRGIDKLLLQIPSYDEGFLPNFREGDLVLFYERNKELDLATNHIVHRGTICSIKPDLLELKLNYQQRNDKAFSTKSLYAIEHDHMDSSTNSLYRGLYTFLQAPKHRRDLILCQRDPEVDNAQVLNGHYTNNIIDHIVLQAKRAQDYFLLVGPPGTGKTSIALRSMVQEFYSEKSNNILLLSYTNRAVDEICEMLESIDPIPPYLRIGNEQNCEVKYRKRLIKNQAANCNTRNDIKNLLLQHRIIVCTVSSLAGQLHTLLKLKHFNMAIIDEASQILEPHLLGILSATDADGHCAIDKFIMIGDHKQLPAVVVQRPEQSHISDEILQNIGLTNRRNSLFERLYDWTRKKQYTGITATLLRQGRMHPDVASFANEHFYGGELLPVPVTHQKEPLEFTNHGKDFQEYVAQTRFGFLHCEYPCIEKNNKVNLGEAKRVAAIVGTIHSLCQMNNLPFNAAQRIGIIVPFRGQIAMIRKELSYLNLPEVDEIVIDTVERFQGSQRDIMIFSTTISQPYQLQILSNPVEIDGQLIDRKLNVALTRAKKQMFIIGNAELLSRNTLYRDLIIKGSTSMEN